MTDELSQRTRPGAAEPKRRPFRLHFADGNTEDVTAENPLAARAAASRDGIITKVKIIRET